MLFIERRCIIQRGRCRFVPYRRDSPETVAAGGSTGIAEAKGYTVEDVREWCAALNAFAAAEVAFTYADVNNLID
jgi:hypothetical protein